MNFKNTAFYVIGSGVLAGALVVVGAVFAQTERSNTTGPASAANIQYPVAELGNCKSQEDCRAYCGASAHIEACVAFAEKNNLMSKDEVDSAKKFISAGAKGPGGCTSKDSCEAYCNDISRIDECVSFAEKSGILPPDQLAEAKQVQAAIARGVTPPPCKSKKECDVYCEEPANMKACVQFGEAAGFLQGKELEDAKKIIMAIDKGATPPPCKGKDACDAYCSAPEHMEACMTFAQAAGLMSPQEAQDSGKALQAIKKGVKPPACRGREECDKYCSEDAHIDECINFSVAAGFMSEKDAEMAKKTGGKGPGGCKSKEECDAFCNNPDNQPTCMNFAKDNGLIPPEELQKMQEGQKRFQESFQNMPQEVLTCLQSSVGGDTLEKLKSGQAMPSRDLGEKMGQCFSQMGGPPGQGQGQKMGPPGAEGGRGIPPLSSLSQETQDCVKSVIGPDAFQQLQSGSTPAKNENEEGLFEKAKNCFEKLGPPGQQMYPQGMMQPNGGMPPQGFRGSSAGMQQIEAQWNGFPPQVQSCLTEKLGSDRLTRIKQGQGTDDDQREVPQTIQECFQQMMQPGNMPSSGNMPFQEGKQQMMHPGAMQPSSGTFPSGEDGNPPPGGMMPPAGNMPPQGGTAPSGDNPPPAGMPPYGSMPSAGSMPPQQMMQPGAMQPPVGSTPPTGGTLPPPVSTPPPAGTLPPPGATPPQSYNPPTLGQFLLGMLAGIFSR